MPTSVVMPQMGESIAEGTIVRWIKKVGDQVERDEPLFEISTDKVDAEIPSPAAGVLTDIKVREGETVGVNTVVATIGQAGEEVRRAGAAETGASAGGPRATQQPDGQSTPAPTPADKTVSAMKGEEPSGNGRRRSSPLVRRIAKEHNVDIAQIPGSGLAGRVTKHDILGFIEHEGVRLKPDATGTLKPAPASDARSIDARTIEERTTQTRAPQIARPTGADRVEKMSVMRKKIAEHMVASRRTSAHVHTVFEVDFSRVAAIREQKKTSYLSFIIKAVAESLKAFPILNASVDGDSVVYHKQINIGVAVALETGLIVPVVKHADQLDLAGIAQCVADLAARARSKHLSPDDVVGGTFTVTNPGAFGALSGTPIINQPQVAILGIGSIEKRPLVVNDAIGFDHRIIDGAVADQFMAQVKRALENWDEKRA
jgi:pyruvate dehydrogenase E2 component (dihydrolipoamide acetyltransferase)